MTRRVILALLTVALLLAGCGHQPGGDDEPVDATAALHCGYERWAVKTGTDPAAGNVNLTAGPATIVDLGHLPSPLPKVTGKYPPPEPRQPAEEVTVTITGTLTAYTIEQDNDLHLVIADSAHHSLIAEIPNPACIHGPSPLAAGITAARHAFVAATGYNPPAPPPGRYTPKFVRSHRPVTATGVLFFDWPHGQYGAAPNAVELHPVLSIRL